MTESTTEHSNEMNQDGRGSYADVHGLKMYYEIHGAGFPLVLLHGGLSTIGTSFGKVLPGLARERQVIAIEHQSLVRKLVVATPISTADGFQPGVLAGMEALQPEHLAGSPFQEEYERSAPNPQDWPTLVAKTKQLDREFVDWSPEAIASIKAPTMLIAGDSDIVRPEHVVELFRLLGGRVSGDHVGPPHAQLA